MAHLLVVDDEQSICWGLTRLATQMGHSVAVAASAEEGFESARSRRPDAVVLDVRLPGMDGLSAMPGLRQELGPIPIIIITAYGQLATAVEAVRNGAFDYLTKPFDLKVVQRTIERALSNPSSHRDDTAQHPDTQAETTMVGTSPAMQEVFKRIALVAPSAACVHIHGESGTGKELVARAIHHYSRRSERPFLPISMASLSPPLVESELFGHARGAFTGAERERKGLLERADGGTVFFDEIADVPLSLQAKLLRALEQGEVLPVGADRTIQSDFRIITATHQNLSTQVMAGAFRHDLYFRLVTFEIELPPLRCRREDIGILAKHFLDALAMNNDTNRSPVGAELLAELQRRPWHGNIRELRNAIEHATIMARGGPVGPEHLPPPAPPLAADGSLEDIIIDHIRQWACRQFQGPRPADDLYERLFELVERPLLETAVRQSHGQCAAAARRLGLHRTTLRKKLDQFGIGSG